MSTVGDDTGRSKSQAKREMLALQALAQRMVELPEGQARRLTLSPEVGEAVQDARAMERRALKRQLRFIAGLLAHEDSAAIERAMSELDRPHIEDVRAFHEVERWRDTLLTGDESPIGEVLRRYPDIDRPHLLRLVRNARNEVDGRGAPGASRLLFRYLMDLRGDA